MKFDLLSSFNTFLNIEKLLSTFVDVNCTHSKYAKTLNVRSYGKLFIKLTIQSIRQILKNLNSFNQQQDDFSSPLDFVYFYFCILCTIYMASHKNELCVSNLVIVTTKFCFSSSTAI